MATRRLLEAIEISFPLEIYQGITYGRTMTYVDKNEEPINLTGKVLSLKIKNVFPTLFTVFSNTGSTPLGSSITITDPANGEFRIKLDEAETALATLGDKGKWWVELYDGGDVDLLWLDCTSVRSL